MEKEKENETKEVEISALDNNKIDTVIKPETDNNKTTIMLCSCLLNIVFPEKQKTNKENKENKEGKENKENKEGKESTENKENKEGKE